ncbi:GntR family transcriptional regulator [Nocardia vinacea]|uniref:GntR family transcriptional regulator n=1 Tax=Nocardia vinacea TaxID=96468 RepID=A0ABZ1YQ76_9NOCA|nr:GntR family transcriptional regulator [Nocardia vinacea]
MRPAPATRTEVLYDVLRSEVLNGKLAPGEKLRLVEFGDRFGVSQTVVREVLTRLAEQGLVVATRQRGFRVRELSVEDISNLTEARVQIETVALRLAIERGDVHWETGILSTHHILDRTPTTLPDGETVNEEWPEHHREFHRALIAGCGNPRLEGIAQSLRASAELYRRWYWVLTDDDHGDIVAEHRQLKELALARDADAAVALLTEHIERPPRQLIAYAREHGVGELG